MAAKKCKCGRKLVLEMDKLRGKCFQCVKEEDRERMLQRRRGGKSRAKTSRSKKSRG